MDTVERIETTRFLGAEFLTWLWFARDTLNGDIDVPGLGVIDVSLEAQIQLTDLVSDGEKIAIRGKNPCWTPEARRALQNGKLPSRTQLRIVYDQAEWVASFDAASMNVSAVRLPAIAVEGEEEQFYERMRLLEQLHDLLGALYAHFLRVRFHENWERHLVPALKAWVQGDLTFDADRFDALHAAEQKSRGTKRAR